MRGPSKTFSICLLKIILLKSSLMLLGSATYFAFPYGHTSVHLMRTKPKQTIWNGPLIEVDRSVVWEGIDRLIDHGWTKSVALIPVTGCYRFYRSSCSLWLSNEAAHVVVGLRLSLDLCRPHLCRYRDLVIGPDGLHGLVCKLALELFLRHQSCHQWYSLAESSESWCSKY